MVAMRSRIVHQLVFKKTIMVQAAERDSRRLRDREITAGNQEAIEIQKERGTSNASATHLSSTTVHKVGHPRQLRTRSTMGKDQECHRCGGKHLAPHCNFKDYECHFCKKKGHLAKVCRKKAAAKERAKTEQANMVTTEDKTGDVEDNQQYSPMFHVTSGSSKPFLVDVVVNGKPLTMELDTGASVSIASEETFDQIREGRSSLGLQKSAVRLPDIHWRANWGSGINNNPS